MLTGSNFGKTLVEVQQDINSVALAKLRVLHVDLGLG